MDDDVDDQRRQAEQAARDDYRRWEHCEPPYDNFVGVSYPWSERPWNLPLHAFEIGLAFKMAGSEDLNSVAAILKVGVERLESALEQFPEWRALCRRRRRERERNQQRARAEYSPVSARDEFGQLIITVKMRRFKQKVEWSANEDGDLEIRFTRDDDAYRDKVKRAKAILGERNGDADS
jgi:hypothetical protein